MIKKLLLSIVFLMGGLSMGYSQEIEDEFKILSEPVPAPEFTLKDLDGNDVSLSDFRGKWVVLDFWGSWCRFCLQSFPEMKNVYAELHPKGLEIIGIDCRDTDEAWRNAVERFQLPWVSLYNPGGEDNIVKKYEVIGYPTYIIINPTGLIYATSLGETPQLYEFLHLLFK